MNWFYLAPYLSFARKIVCKVWRDLLVVEQEFRFDILSFS